MPLPVAARSNSTPAKPLTSSPLLLEFRQTREVFAGRLICYAMARTQVSFLIIHAAFTHVTHHDSLSCLEQLLGSTLSSTAAAHA
jgi:hypothetical protein